MICWTKFQRTHPMSDTARQAPAIELRDNGPLLVKNLKDFRLPDGTGAPEKPIMALCRCGQSKNKPYCDGSHAGAGFDSTAVDVSHRDRVYSYVGAKTTVYYNKLLCSHAGECGRLAVAVFDPTTKPWVQPDNGSLEDITDVVTACPSGALRMSLPGDPPQAITGESVAITIEKNGPYHVTNVAVGAPYWGEGQDEKKYVLCRCGLSGNKPFCDGTHRDKAWQDGS
jgi:CDGSH-type Zn-finger protein